MHQSLCESSVPEVVRLVREQKASLRILRDFYCSQLNPKVCSQVTPAEVVEAAVQQIEASAVHKAARRAPYHAHHRPSDGAQ